MEKIKKIIKRVFGISTIILCGLTILPMFILIIDHLFNGRSSYFDRFVKYTDITLP